MSHINENLGLKPAGKRNMMKLPKNRADAAQITAAKCPQCQRTGARASKTKGQGWLYFPCCNTVSEMSAAIHGGE